MYLTSVTLPKQLLQPLRRPLHRGHAGRASQQLVPPRRRRRHPHDDQAGRLPQVREQEALHAGARRARRRRLLRPRRGRLRPLLRPARYPLPAPNEARRRPPPGDGDPPRGLQHRASVPILHRQVHRRARRRRRRREGGAERLLRRA